MKSRIIIKLREIAAVANSLADDLSNESMRRDELIMRVSRVSQGVRWIVDIGKSYEQD